MTPEPPGLRVLPVCAGRANEPSLALGMIAAALRERYPDSDGPVVVEQQVRDPSIWAREQLDDDRHAVFLFANYLWSSARNCRLSRLVKEVLPDAVCVHGGPDTPQYQADNEGFFAQHRHIDVTVRREGERTAEDLIAALLDGDWTSRAGRLAQVEGASTRRADGTVERAGDRDRIDDLSVLPSPFFSGEFNQLDPSSWRFGVLETNRGCPYGCTFCDWGSATLSRIRQFPMDRISAEITWLAEHKVPYLFIADANFGILERDVEIADQLARVRERHGFPLAVSVSFAKNTAKHVIPIIERWTRAGILSEGVLALQSVDPGTLRAIKRRNIKLETYGQMAAEFDHAGLPLASDLILGLPGSTPASLRADLQHLFDSGVTARVFDCRLLPNSPMNAPEYQAEHRIEAGADGVLVSTATYTPAERLEMHRMRYWFRALDHLGIARHTLRFLQYELRLPALEVMRDLEHSVQDDPARLPLLAWVGRAIDIITAPPVGWAPLQEELLLVLGERYGLQRSPSLDTVMRVDRHLLPDHGRALPATLDLPFDYVSYYRSVLAPAIRDGTPPGRRLEDFGPGSLTVDDPFAVCRTQIATNKVVGRRDLSGENPFWWDSDWELESPLARQVARTYRARKGGRGDDDAVPVDLRPTRA